MENEETSRPIRKASLLESNLGTIGVIITCLYLLWGAYLYGSRPTAFHALKLNELGDFLAGFFGPLALGWLVLGFFQQRTELSQNTAALRLQYDELKESVKHQKSIAETAAMNSIEEGVKARGEFNL